MNPYSLILVLLLAQTSTLLAGPDFWIGLATDEKAPGTKAMKYGDATLYVSTTPVVTGKDVALASPRVPPNGWAWVTLSLTDEAAGKMLKATRGNLGKQLAVVWKGKVLTSLVIRSPVSGELRVSGNNVTPDVANTLAQELNPKKKE